MTRMPEEIARDWRNYTLAMQEFRRRRSFASRAPLTERDRSREAMKPTPPSLQAPGSGGGEASTPQIDGEKQT